MKHLRNIWQSVVARPGRRTVRTTTTVRRPTTDHSDAQLEFWTALGSYEASQILNRVDRKDDQQ